MKKINLLSIVTVIMLLWSMNMNAQMEVGTFTEFDAALTTLKGTPGGGSILLKNNITIDIAKDDVYSLSSIAGNPITIQTDTFTITANGNNAGLDIASTNAILEVGDNMKITGGATLLTPLGRATIKVIGGEIACVAVEFDRTTNLLVPAAIYSTGGGRIWVTDGIVSVFVPAGLAANKVNANPFAIYVNNYMDLTIEGGTISGGGKAGVRTIRVGTNSTANISGASISIDDLGGIAVLCNGSSIMKIGSNTAVTASGSSTALNSDGASTALVINRNASNVTIIATAGKSYVSSTSGGLFDLRDLALVITPSVADPGFYTFPTPSTVAVTATGASATEAPPYFYYNIGNSPVASPTSVSGNQVAGASSTIGINFTDTYLKIRLGKGNWIDDVEIPLHYKVTTVSSTVYVAGFNQLVAAYEASQTGNPRTTNIELSDTVLMKNTSFSMIPAANYPVVLNTGGKYIELNGTSNTSHVYQFGGSLTVSGASNANGLFFVNGSSLIEFTGGSYTVNGNGVIFQTNTGGTGKTTGILRLSNASFEANGTTNAAGIIKFNSSDYKEFTATNCNFKVSSAGVSFYYKGATTLANGYGKFEINGGSLNNLGTGDAFVLGSGNQPMTVTINGLNLTMASGNVFGNYVGSKTMTVVIKDLQITGNASVAKPGTGGDAATNKFYDFRSFSINPTPGAGAIASATNVTLASVDAGTGVDATGAIVRYTTDGSEPTATSSQYLAAVSVIPNQTIKVAVEKDGFIGKSYSFAYPLATNIEKAAIDASIAYISGNTLYLPEVNQSVQIFNISGQLILNTSANGCTIDVSDLNKGIYIVKVGKSAFKVAK